MTDKTTQLFPLAVKSQIPLVAVETDDPMNAVRVISELVGKQVKAFPTANGKAQMDAVKEGGCYVLNRPDVDKTDFDAFYKAMDDADATVVIVNANKPHTAFFDAGVITCPPSLIKKFIKANSDLVEDTPEFDSVMAALSGLSFKGAKELTMLAGSQSGEFSGRALQKVRRMLYGSIRGLQQENTESGFYKPNEALTHWLAEDGKLLMHSKHKKLTPRGLLLDGPPGTGKTEAAKFLARELSLPLYRLDIAGSMGKYVGESEKAVRMALTQVDQCGPCVMLIDEVEKLFASGSGEGDSGVTTRILSQLLWWLQEHTSRVFTVMTTNKATVIPPELVRPGRLDAKLYFGELESADGLEFMLAVASASKDMAELTKKEVTDLHKHLYGIANTKSHAALSTAVMGLIKKKYIATL